MINKNLYRLGALMYDGDTPSYRRDTTIRKIIESYFYLNDNKMVRCNELPSEINDMFHIYIHIDEICKIVKSNSKFELSNGTCKSKNHDSCCIDVKLTESRFELVKNREETGSIYRFIDDYYSLNDELIKEISKRDFTGLIERFLYAIYVQNMEKSQKMFDLGIDNNYLTSDLDITDREKDIINDFLDYDNNGKNKAIFDIGSLALEFVILNGNINIQNQQSNILKKTLYLDTNILFRMMGINGEQRRRRVRTLIKRCVETGQEVKITYASRMEFFHTVNHHLLKVEGYTSQIHYTEPIKDAVIRHYFESKSGNVKFYIAKLEAEYESTLKELGIKYDDYDYESFARGDERVRISEYKTSIADYKHQREVEIAPDAINIAYIQNIRKNQGNSFRELKEFFLTSDKILIDWEVDKLESYPAAMYPSNWLSIILKFGSRTNDDYKSFVSFIKNVSHEENRDSETVLATLKVIATKAQSMEKEKALYDIFIENDYKEAIELSSFKEKEEFAEVKVQEYIDKKFEEYKKREAGNIARIEEMENRQKILEEKEVHRKEEAINNRIEIVKAQYAQLIAERKSTLITYGIVLFASVIFFYLLWRDFSWQITEKEGFKILTDSNSMGVKYFLTSFIITAFTTSIIKLWNVVSKKTMRKSLLEKEISPQEIDTIINKSA